MTIATYAELLIELDAWLNRSDLSARIPTFIKLFESRMNRTLRAPAMEVLVTTSTVASDASIVLPADFLAMRSLYIDGDPDTVLEAMSLAALRDTYGSATTGLPRAYTILGGSIMLAPTPDGVYALNQSYFQAIPALGGATPINWLLSAFPDAYLYGTLAIASAYLKDDERVGAWMSAWDQCIAEMHAHFNRQRTPAAPITLRPTVIE